MLEQKFILPLRLQGRFLKIGGKIDRVDQTPDGGIEIIDYKTGAKVPSQKDIDEDLQMSFYALAASMLETKPFPVDPEKIKLSLYYFDEQKFISTTRSKEQLQAAIEEIFVVAEKIENSDFQCSGSRLCQDCEFKMLCDIKTTS
jgi:DNA helicase-2/ATP-dependent DNA helicase PcrA